MICGGPLPISNTPRLEYGRDALVAIAGTDPASAAYDIGQLDFVDDAIEELFVVSTLYAVMSDCPPDSSG